ncbi:hypothetical protein L6164_018237 [Bauhinia variegata]|uniref:Uncharacterized protein n=1 Tax=Bauhinia variegata TaxID=167791 RepID=A0ACB9NAC6_BAUVA|nr:hypothetical protein L6164_018237 [Bauhinia variegata]
MEAADFISALPSDVQSIIVSKLPIDECVRTCVLSKKWESVWKDTMHMEIHLKSMVVPSSLRNHPYAYLSIIRNLMRADKFRLYSERVLSLLNSHSAEIRSISFVHFTRNLIFGHLETWLRFLAEEMKKIEHLSLQCEPADLPVNIRAFPIASNYFNLSALAPGIFSFLASLELTNYYIQSANPFEGCQRLQTLKMRRIHVDEKILSGILQSCNFLEKFKLSESNGFKKLKIQNPNLKLLELAEFSVKAIEVLVEGLQVLILGTLFCPANEFIINARSLRMFYSHCTMNNPQRVNAEMLTNQAILENCSDLFVRKRSEGESSSSGDCFLSYPKSKFWEIRGIPNSIISKLKYVTVSGFQGTEQEVGFVEEVITKATMMQRITIFCSCDVKEATFLLSELPRASRNLSIVLKPKNRVVG